VNPNPTLVIFGASGDLTRRLLLPALYHLELAAKLPPLRIVGYAREPWSEEQFVEHLRRHVEQQLARRFEREVWERFARRLTYRSGDLSPSSIAGLADLVPGPGIFYLALPPGLFGAAGEALGKAGFADESRGFRRLVVEKPFGVDLPSARALNAHLTGIFREDQVLRIDHFLGKETVQNLFVFRLANWFVEPVWGSGHVEAVHITVAETLGLEGRQKYYDDIGALRDMVQNHMLQLLAITALEPPGVWEAEVIRDHKVEVLKSVHPIAAGQVSRFAVRGRYTRGKINGVEVPGYLEEPGVPASSRTETFVALKLFVDNWRWKGVPFYLRTGKRLAASMSEIAVQLRDPPTRLFKTSSGAASLEANWFLFQIQPEKTIDLIAQAKRPGLELVPRTVTLHTPYERQGDPDFSAYEQLLLDAIEGDRTHFLRFDEVEWSWKVIEPVLEAWKQGEPVDHEAGSEGPPEQRLLLEPGHEFRPITRQRLSSASIAACEEVAGSRQDRQ
jgi:glucose-6-phosphate 1-dehydrogenase